MSHEYLLKVDPEKKFEQAKREFFLQFTRAITSLLANDILKDISRVHKNPIACLGESWRPQSLELSKKLGFNPHIIFHKEVTKKQRKIASSFLIDGTIEMLSDLLSKKMLDMRESSVVRNFRNARTPEGNCYTIYGIKTLLEEHFSSSDKKTQKPITSIEGKHKTWRKTRIEIH